MTRQEFVDALERALRGAGISEYDISDNINYYNSYFKEQMNFGRTEAEVVEELGDPRLIAKTIVGVPDDDEQVSGSYDSETGTFEEHAAEDFAGSRRGFRAEMNGNGWDVRIGRFKLNSLLGYLLIGVIVFAVISVVGSLITVIAPIVFPVLIIMLVLSFFKNRR